MAIVVRNATLTEAPELARVQSESWQLVYRGLLPDEILDQPDFIEHNTRVWTKALTNQAANQVIATALLNGRIIGVASSGPPLDDDATWGRQLYTMYVAAEVYGQGVGKALLDFVLSPKESAALFVAEANQRAISFYRKHGFEPDGVAQNYKGIKAIRMVRTGLV